MKPKNKKPRTWKGYIVINDFNRILYFEAHAGVAKHVSLSREGESVAKVVVTEILPKKRKARKPQDH